ncbi:hypothetical protein ECG_02159 [Echinococcus granulosus]|uniref:Ovule protein n=1 Tax=Echinococcus granulosus TaxID=6210 RepID=A0A068WTN8_ECHGR|nr:hypothetical protein ECG_02159 [Echinococcus granulosus]CDS21802.1 hypothetical protein EgrG_000130500 [Echinococcus granulosus]
MLCQPVQVALQKDCICSIIHSIVQTSQFLRLSHHLGVLISGCLFTVTYLFRTSVINPFPIPVLSHIKGGAIQHRLFKKKCDSKRAGNSEELMHCPAWGNLGTLYWWQQKAN